MNCNEFKIHNEYKDKGIEIPKRLNKLSPYYEIKAAEDVIVPSYPITMLHSLLIEEDYYGNKSVSARKVFERDVTSDYLKRSYKDLILFKDVKTGLIVNTKTSQYVKVITNSNLVLVKDEPITSNEREFKVSLINLSTKNIIIKKGEVFCYAMFCECDSVRGDSI